jgi:Protein of unknown function (DUF3237)
LLGAFPWRLNWWRSETEHREKGCQYLGKAIQKLTHPKNFLAAGEFLVLGYLGFIQNILGRIRTLILGCLFLLVAATLSVSSYPFDPLPVLGGMFMALFLHNAKFVESELPDVLKSVRTRPLFLLREAVPPLVIVGQTPNAFRRIGVIQGGSFEGERLSGEVVTGNDWRDVRKDSCI